MKPCNHRQPLIHDRHGRCVMCVLDVQARDERREHLFADLGRVAFLLAIPFAVFWSAWFARDLYRLLWGAP